MPGLYDVFLPLVQSINNYGGNFASIQIREPVLDAIDAQAPGDPALRYVCDMLHAKMKQWRGLQDHKTFSEFVEAYYEGVFYLTALQRGVALRNIPAGADRDRTPDFATTSAPSVNFEVKTLDVADPARSYNKIMEGALDARIEAEDKARRFGHGTSAREIAPHGDAKNFKEVIEQVMRKVDSNVKAGQYEDAPTFMVIATGRTSVHARPENLRKWLPWPGLDQPASGQLYAIASHELDQPFFFPEDNWTMANLGPIGRAGVLRDHGFIAGLIFLVTELGASNSPAPVEGVYSLNGIWNSAWENNNPFGPQAVAAAKKVFEKLCDAWNDTDDSRRELLPM